MIVFCFSWPLLPSKLQNSLRPKCTAIDISAQFHFALFSRKMSACLSSSLHLHTLLVSQWFGRKLCSDTSNQWGLHSLLSELCVGWGAHLNSQVSPDFPFSLGSLRYIHSLALTHSYVDILLNQPFCGSLNSKISLCSLFCYLPKPRW